MRRASLVVLAILLVALLAGCGGGGSGDRTAAIGAVTVTIPSDVHGVKDELKALLAQFPYQRWYTACVERRFAANGAPEEGSLDQILAKAGAACEKGSDRPLVDPNATTEELALLRAALVPTMEGLAESNGLDPTESRCLTEAFEKLPAKFIVEFGNGDEKTRGAILSTIVKTCAEAG